MVEWAAGLAEGGLRQTADGWVADSPMGTVTVEFAPPNEFGVLDHVVRLPSGETVYNPTAGDPGRRRGAPLRGAVQRATAGGHDQTRSSTPMLRRWPPTLKTLRRLLED